MITYSSYNPPSFPITKNVLTIALINSGTEFFAGLVVFSILGILRGPHLIYLRFLRFLVSGTEFFAELVVFSILGTWSRHPNRLYLRLFSWSWNRFVRPASSALGLSSSLDVSFSQSSVPPSLGPRRTRRTDSISYFPGRWSRFVLLGLIIPGCVPDCF